LWLTGSSIVLRSRTWIEIVEFFSYKVLFFVCVWAVGGEGVGRDVDCLCKAVSFYTLHAERSILSGSLQRDIKWLIWRSVQRRAELAMRKLCELVAVVSNWQLHSTIMFSCFIAYITVVLLFLFFFVWLSWRRNKNVCIIVHSGS